MCLERAKATIKCSWKEQIYIIGQCAGKDQGHVDGVVGKNKEN